jgi:hypothetical protein
MHLAPGDLNSQVSTCYHSVMTAADIFRPEQWTNFFLLVGTGAVTLTGLVFVAMSLNLKEIAVDATHRNRAINTLTGLALVFMRCALVLMGAQNHQAIGAELFIVSGISGVVFWLFGNQWGLIESVGFDGLRNDGRFNRSEQIPVGFAGVEQ